MPGTIQEYYDECVKACVDGRFPSLSPQSGGSANGCVYRGPGGRACAVGIRIPDEMYRKNFERMCVNNLPHDVLRAVLPDGMSVDELTSVQETHDDAALRMKGEGRRAFIQEFISVLNELPCFNGVVKADPEEVASRVH